MTALPGPAAAFSTRVHIVLANRLREAMLARDDGALPLSMGARAVRLSEEDRAALRDHPLAFRAGAVGPDNMVFPGMTDPSHALLQRPYDQCELLYRAALLPEERAYALGCFLHGASDAIAHHYVNFMTGETFTLNPLTAERKTAYSNVVRHITAETMIQKAVQAADPDAFRTGALVHTIPKSFVLRAYLDEGSPLWQLIARHAKARFDAARARDPAASLPTLLSGLDLAPAEHLVLTPVYLRSIDASLQQVQRDIQAAVAAMQDTATPEGAQLRVSAGADGKLGTSDDRTACAATCPTLYARYFTYVGLLAPRQDAMGRPLPSALSKISEKLRDDLFQFLPAYLQTVEGLSAKLNAPPAAGSDGLELDAAEVTRLFQPLTGWADKLTALDYETLIRAVVPEWLISLQDALRAVGVNVSIAGIVEALLQPVVRPIKDAIKAQAIDRAQRFISDLSAEYRRLYGGTTAEFEERLRRAAGPGLSGTALDHFFESGLYAHAYNLTAAALARHEILLPQGEDEAGIGPSSFDASYTPSWSQAGLCADLRAAVFPFGLDVRGLLFVRQAGQDHPPQLSEDSPVECHDGSLSRFAERPSERACALTGLAGLLADPAHRGSLSRAFPPQLSAQPPRCLGLIVPGLEPEGSDMNGDRDLGPGPGPGGDPDLPGCSCRIGGPGTGAQPQPQGGALFLGIVLSLGLLRSRRSMRPGHASGQRRGRWAAFSLLALLLAPQAGCSPQETTEADGGAGDMDRDMGMGMGMGIDGGDGGMDGAVTDLGPSPGRALLLSLDGSVWSGKGMRQGKERALELRFDSKSLLWAEIRNPYGPSRRRELRVMTVDADGATVRTTVVSPVEWPDAREIGRKDEWRLEVMPGTPRRLRASRGGVTEEYTEGAAPRPQDGLTATVRTFSSGGRVDKAFCSSGAGGFTYGALFDFARGRGAEAPQASDTAAGARLLRWRDASGENRFAVTDVNGFAGTDLSDQYNFVVTYRGVVKHPGGALQVRELNDVVEDGLWIFIGDKVGSNNTSDLLLEVHGFVWADLTPDAPSVTLPAGDIPIEVILVRCAKAISDVDVQIRLAGGSYQLVGDAPTRPDLSDSLFPPAL